MNTYKPQISLLRRQINKATREDNSIDVNLLAELVDRVYQDNAKERRMADSTLKMMSAELLDSNKDLRAQAERLKASQERLLETSQQTSQAARLAGMAEVATNILHNIGNTLNSVNTSLGVLIDRFKNTKFNNMYLLANMLRENQHDYVGYFTNDPKGKLVPGYFLEIAEHWVTQSPILSAELVQLSKNIDHIKDCIALQQSMAKKSGMLEPTQLDKIMDSILELHASEYKANGLEIIKTYQDLPILMLDRIKLYQIFVNLIQNARQSILLNESSAKEITITITSDLTENLSISIMDTGVGITQENLKKIFSHGFTTKEDGNGFGLHYCANAATEMGGQMSADSPGEGKGATFTLTIPYKTAGQYGETDAV